MSVMVIFVAGEGQVSGGMPHIRGRKYAGRRGHCDYWPSSAYRRLVALSSADVDTTQS